MAKFITSIQLQDADERDYDTLHKELEKVSFKDEKHAAKSEAYIAGKHSFSREGNITLQQVTHTVAEVASKIGKKYSFTVIRDKHVAASN